MKSLSLAFALSLFPLTGCASAASSDTLGLQDPDVAVQGNERRGGGRSGGGEVGPVSGSTTVDAGTPAVVVYPSGFVRGDHTLPLPTEVPVTWPQGLDCATTNPLWNRRTFYPITEAGVARLGDGFHVREYSYGLGETGPEDLGEGSTYKYNLTKTVPNAYARTQTALTLLDLHGTHTQYRDAPFEVRIEENAGAMTGTYSRYSYLANEPDPVTTPLTCTFQPFPAPMVYTVYLQSNFEPMAHRGLACHVTSGPRAGRNMVVHPIVDDIIVRVGGVFLSYYDGPLDGAWNESRAQLLARHDDTTFLRASRDQVSEVYHYTPFRPGDAWYGAYSKIFDFHGVTKDLGTWDVRFTEATEMRGYVNAMDAVASDGSGLADCQLVDIPASLKVREIERNVEVGFPLAPVVRVQR